MNETAYHAGAACFNCGGAITANPYSIAHPAHGDWNKGYNDFAIKASYREQNRIL